MKQRSEQPQLVTQDFPGRDDSNELKDQAEATSFLKLLQRCTGRCDKEPEDSAGTPSRGSLLAAGSEPAVREHHLELPAGRERPRSGV